MGLPVSVDKSILLSRAMGMGISDRELRTGSRTSIQGQVPYRIMQALDGLISCLLEESPNLSRLAVYARTIFWWHLDQGHDEIPIHADLGKLSLDILKMVEIDEALTKAQTLKGQVDGIDEIVSILETMNTTFASDGRLDDTAYSVLGLKLIALVGTHKQSIEKYADVKTFII